jgi:hypothetical protein
LAISDKTEQISLTRYNKANGWQTISENVGEYAKNKKFEVVKINSNTFENFLNFYCLKYIDLIKIDIEGAELLALNSIRDRLVNKQINKIIFEANKLTLELFDESIKSLLDFWLELPYKISVIKENGDLCDLETVLKDNVVFFDCIAELH